VVACVARLGRSASTTGFALESQRPTANLAKGQSWRIPLQPPPLEMEWHLPPAYTLHDNVKYLLSCFFLTVVYKCMPYLLSSRHPDLQPLWPRERPTTSISNARYLFQLNSRLGEQPRAPIQGTHDLQKPFLASRRLNDSFELHVFHHVCTTVSFRS
jgi:hypothetical protein